MLDMREFLDDHESIRSRTNGVADTVDIVAGKVNKHDMFGPVFETCPQLVSKLEIFSRGCSALDCASDGVCNYAVGIFLSLDEEFGGGADKMER